MAKRSTIAQRLTIWQIEQRFPSEWILLTEPETDDAGQVIAGKVAFHSKNRDDVYREAIKLKSKDIATHDTGTIPKGSVVVL